MLWRMRDVKRFDQFMEIDENHEAWPDTQSWLDNVAEVSGYEYRNGIVHVWWTAKEWSNFCNRKSTKT